VLVAGLLAGYGVAVPVGGIAVLVVGLSARGGLRVGVAAALGVATVDGGYALVAVLGGAAVARVIQPVSGPLRWVAAVVLVGIAVRTAVVAMRARVGGPPVMVVRPGRAYLSLVGLTALNPATIVYFAALVLGRQAAGPLGVLDGVIFVVAAFAASASWQLLLAGGGGLIGRFADTARGRMVTALVASSVITVLAVRLVVN